MYPSDTEEPRLSILLHFLEVNRDILPPAYKEEDALADALRRKCLRDVGGEADTDSADAGHNITVEDLSRHEQDLLADKEMREFMDMDDARLQQVLADLEKEVHHLYGTSSAQQDFQMPSATTFIRGRAGCTMSAETLNQSRSILCKEMYKLVQKQNAAERDLVELLGRHIEDIQSAEQPTPQQLAKATDDINRAFMHLKMSMSDKRERSISQRFYRAKKHAKQEKYLNMSPSEQTEHIATLKRHAIEYLKAHKTM